MCVLDGRMGYYTLNWFLFKTTSKPGETLATILCLQYKKKKTECSASNWNWTSDTVQLRLCYCGSVFLLCLIDTRLRVNSDPPEDEPIATQGREIIFFFRQFFQILDTSY